ncbi:MAG: MFS transporter [Candidatus Sericytochromatia bacterium]|nr:MFS transporter [Candidatus Sericytochromatia bacterium]
MGRPSAVWAWPPFAAVLAMTSLPVFLWLPTLYSSLGIGLGAMGLILLLARLGDAVLDPWIGQGCDRWPGGARRIMSLATPVLALAVLALFRPPSGIPALPWLGCSLLAFTVAFSASSIAHAALGMTWGAGDAQEGTRLWTIREAWGLLGTLAATILPHVLGGPEHPEQGLRPLAVGLALALPLLMWPALLTPESTRARANAPQPTVSSGPGLRWKVALAPLHDPFFRRLMAVFLVNGTASALPAATVVFFVRDRLEAGTLLPAFLISYMAAGAAGMPFWTRRAARVGDRRAWQEAILLATAAFIWAVLLGRGQVWGYAAVCLAAGLALGAEVALPPAILSRHLAGDQTRRMEGRAFGWLGTAGKINLALAGAISLPLLDAVGFATGTANTPAALTTLSVVYAGLPCFLKAWAWKLLSNLEAPKRPGPPDNKPEALDETDAETT